MLERVRNVPKKHGMYKEYHNNCGFFTLLKKGLEIILPPFWPWGILNMILNVEVGENEFHDN